MSDYLPEEILIQILARLPVKSLLQFRCVSKSWYSLISSSDFINTHLNLNNNNNLLLLKHTYFTSVNFLLLQHTECYYTLNHEDTLDKYAYFEYPFTGHIDKFKIDGSCNGLLCLSDYTNTTIILWNPSIKKYVTLPKPNITNTRPTISVVGFGFDYRANDYKVVRIQYMSDNNPPQAELCELSKGTWRQITCTVVRTCTVYGFMSQAYINGVVHWIALDQRGASSIVAFDLVDEVFREMVMPNSIAGVASLNMSIGTFEESLVVYHLNKLHCTCSVWVMKEYGVAKSWVKQSNIVLEGGLKNVERLMKNGELLLGTISGNLVLYNPEDQQMKDVKFPIVSSYYVDTYMESLVLLKERKTNSCEAITSKRKEDEMKSNSAKHCQGKERQLRKPGQEAERMKKTRRSR